MRRTKLWIQQAIEKPGALSRQLGIPVKDNIPVSLLKRIKSAKIGTVIKNPSKKGKKRIKVTRLLKKRAVLALTLKKLSGKKKKMGRKKRRGRRRKRKR